jgi:hypothetical protein
VPKQPQIHIRGIVKPVNNGQTKSVQANFDTNFDLKPSTEQPPLYNGHFLQVPRVVVVDWFDCIQNGIGPPRKFSK